MVTVRTVVLGYLYRETGFRFLETAIRFLYTNTLVPRFEQSPRPFRALARHTMALPLSFLTPFYFELEVYALEDLWGAICGQCALQTPRKNSFTRLKSIFSIVKRRL